MWLPTCRYTFPYDHICTLWHCGWVVRQTSTTGTMHKNNNLDRLTLKNNHFEAGKKREKLPERWLQAWFATSNEHLVCCGFWWVILIRNSSCRKHHRISKVNTVGTLKSAYYQHTLRTAVLEAATDHLRRSGCWHFEEALKPNLQHYYMFFFSLLAVSFTVWQLRYDLLQHLHHIVSP